MNTQVEALAGQLIAERDHAEQIWTILNELRIHGCLPDWAKALHAGTMRQADEMTSARNAVNASLFLLIPGLEQAVESAAKRGMASSKE